MVFSAFIKRIPKGMQINHIDGSRDNNVLENLELVTRKQNAQHAVKIGRLSKEKMSRAGSKNGNSILNWVQVRDIRRKFKNGTPNKILATEYEMSLVNIQRITSFRAWVE